MTVKNDEENPILGKELRFAIHIPSQYPDIEDTHLLKEIIHYKDGTIKPNVRLLYNFKRYFYITKPNYRNHNQKKEYENIDHLNCYQTIQSDLSKNIAKALDINYGSNSIRELSKSPYLYGSDVSSTSILKKIYVDKYSNLKSPFTVAFYDIETDVFSEDYKIIIATIVFKNEVLTCINKSFLEGISDPITLINKAMDKYLSTYINKLNLKCSTVICDTEFQVINTIFKKLHEWKPDLLAIWNVNFDIPKTVAAIERAGINPKDIFSDPTIPFNYRSFLYKQGKHQKQTASGKVTPIVPSSQWHIVKSLSSFFVIDAMCIYKRLRIHEGEDPSYALDNILEKELGIRKLNFKEASHIINKTEWHRFMQSKYKIEYIIYNRFDCISMLELENKTKDLTYKLSTFANFTDLESFNLSTRKISDAMHYHLLDRNMVIGTLANTKRKFIEIPDNKKGRGKLGDKKDEGEKDYVVDLDNSDQVMSLRKWIVTLRADYVVLNGMKCIKQSKHTRTNIRAFVFDSDCTAAYPSATSSLNVSKATTKNEIITIEGIPETLFRRQNMNLLSGSTNAIEYCTEMFNLPNLVQLLNMYTNKQS